MSRTPSPMPEKIARYLVYTAAGFLVPGSVLMRRFGIKHQSDLHRYVSDYNARVRQRAGFPIVGIKGPDGGYRLKRFRDA